MPPHLKKSTNQAHLENGTSEQIVSHLEKKLELNDSEAPDELQLNTVTQQATQQNSEKPKPTCHHCKSLVIIGTSAVDSNEEKTKPEITRIVLMITTMIMVLFRQTLTSTRKLPTIPTQTIGKIKKTGNPDLSTHPVRPLVKLTIPQRIVTLEQMQRSDRLHGTDDRRHRIRSNKEMPRATQMGMFKIQPKI